MFRIEFWIKDVIFALIQWFSIFFRCLHFFSRLHQFYHSLKYQKYLILIYCAYISVQSSTRKYYYSTSFILINDKRRKLRFTSHRNNFILCFFTNVYLNNCLQSECKNVEKCLHLKNRSIHLHVFWQESCKS